MRRSFTARIKPTRRGRTKMWDNSTKSGKESAERDAGNGFHSANKQPADTTQPNRRPATATFIVAVSVEAVAVVSKAWLALGTLPPIRSVADFGGVYEQNRFIRTVKIPVRSARSLWTGFSSNLSGSAEHSRMEVLA